MPKKKSGVRYGQRVKQKGQSDLAQLITCKRFLKDRFHMNFKREPYLIFDLNKRLIAIKDHVNTKEASHVYTIKNPDLVCLHKKYGLIVIEIDGDAHLNRLSKDRVRNELYKSIGAKLIVIQTWEIKKGDLVGELERKISKLLSLKTG